MNALAELLSSPVKAELFRLLFGQQSEERYVRELSRLSGCAFSAVQRELEKLEHQGLITPRKDGNRTYFRANERHPFYQELCSLVRKSRGMPEALTQALSGLRIQVAFIFGSEAAGTSRPGSDVDLMVIGSSTLKDIVAKMHPLEEKLKREINPHVFGGAEFAKRVRQKDHFLTTVLREPKIFLIGDANELEGLAG